MKPIWIWIGFVLIVGDQSIKLGEVLNCSLDDDDDDMFAFPKVTPPCGDEEDGAVGSRVSEESNMSFSSDPPESDDTVPKDLSQLSETVRIFNELTTSEFRNSDLN